LQKRIDAKINHENLPLPLPLRPKKDTTLRAAKQLAPQFTELLRDLQKDGGRICFSSEISSIQNYFGSYVLIYDNELKIGSALFLALFGVEGFKEFVAETESATPEEQQQLIEDFSDLEGIDELVEAFEIPQSPAEWKSAREKLALLPEEERKEAEKRSAFFWSFYFSNFFNTLSLMVHGSKMTSLVPRAMEGDDDAFLKAVQIDRMLLLHHPFFRDRKFKAQNEGKKDFLAKLSYRESSPPLRGKIQYPGLYMLFGILEASQWLSDLKHEEILDICDQAGLDRYQNRIEDVNYLTKRLIEYRRWQKTGGVSMR